MIRNVTVAFFIFCTTITLAACGDAGDHFLEFRKNPQPTPTSSSATPTSNPTGTNGVTVAHLKIAILATPNPASSATLPLTVTAYSSSGTTIATGKGLNAPIVLTSNASCNIAFTAGSQTGTSLTLSTAPGSVTIAYSPPGATCTAPSRITITASSSTAKPQTTQVSFAGEGTAASVHLSMLSPPNPSSNGIYPFFVSAKTANGQTISPGALLTNPIQLSSNASCVTGFELTSSTTSAPTLTLSTVGQIYLAYTPSGATSTCPAPHKVIVTGVASGAPPATYSFIGARPAVSPTPPPVTRVARIALSIPATPNPKASGTFELVVNAASSNGKAIAPGTPLKNPIVLTTNSSCNITFTNGSSFTTAPGSVNVSYSPAGGACSPPSAITISAFDVDASPKSASITVVGDHGSGTVASISLRLLATPDPSSNGVYSMFVTAKSANGKTIPQGQIFSNPIQISSNASCVVEFGTSSANLTTTYTMTAADSQLLLAYSPSDVTSTCPAPKMVVVSASASGAKSGSVRFAGPASIPTPTPPAIADVARIALSMPATPNPQSGGTFTLVVKLFQHNGNVVPVGTKLKSPVQLTSNSSCSVTYVNGGTTGTAIALTTAPGTLTVDYTAPNGGCTPPSQIEISAFDLSAAPQTASFSLLGGGSKVKTIVMSLLHKPTTSSAGVYPLFVTTKTSNGHVIPFGQTLTNPVQLSSNASCVLFFGTNPAGDFSDVYTMTNTTTQVYILFNPGLSSPACPGPNGHTVIIQAIATSAKASTYSFKF